MPSCLCLHVSPNTPIRPHHSPISSLAIGGSRSWATYEVWHALVCLLHDESLAAQDLRPPINTKVGMLSHDEPLEAQDLGPPMKDGMH